MQTKSVNQAHANCAAKILRFTSMQGAGVDDCQGITEFTSRLLYGERADYSLLLSAQEEIVMLGGSIEMLDEIRRDFLH